MSQFPTKFIDAEQLVITSNSPTVYTEYNFNTQVNKFGDLHRWEVEFTTPPLNPTLTRELNAYINSLGGRYTTFTMAEPLPWLGQQDATMAVGGNHTKGSTTLQIFGFENNNTEACQAGNFITIAGHAKVYQITSATMFNGVGVFDIEIFPPLTADVTNGTALTNATFNLRLTKDLNALDLNASAYNTRVLITAVEDV